MGYIVVSVLLRYAEMEFERLALVESKTRVVRSVIII